MKNTNHGKLVGGLIAAWFAFALTASALHLYKTDPNLPPLALGLSVLTPMAVFFVGLQLQLDFGNLRSR